MFQQEFVYGIPYNSSYDIKASGKNYNILMSDDVQLITQDNTSVTGVNQARNCNYNWIMGDYVQCIKCDGNFHCFCLVKVVVRKKIICQNKHVY